MLDRIIDWCVHHRVMVLLMAAALCFAGLWSAKHVAIDAIPDLSDVQVIVRADYAGQAPQLVEQQVTYPLTTALMATADTQVVRGYSMFGTSFVYVIFKDGTDLYWARSRVLEQLSVIGSKLPAGVKPELGPDATGVGWVYEYVLTTGRYVPAYPDGLWHDPTAHQWFTDANQAPNPDKLVHHRIFNDDVSIYFDAKTKRGYDSLQDAPSVLRPQLTLLKMAESDQSLAELRSLQDWFLRYELTAVDGVSEVAPVGGYVKQYQVTVDPLKLLAFDLPLGKIKQAIARSNVDVGGRLIEQGETEFMVRSLGNLGTLSDEEILQATKDGKPIDRVRTEKVLDQLSHIPLGATSDGSPIYLKDVAQVHIGPEIRRGAADWQGQGEVVGGIVVMRAGGNAQAVIARVRDKLHSLENTLPGGVAIRESYDRSGLIQRAVATLNHTLLEEILIVSLVCVLFLLHARSALIAACVLPAGVLMTLTIMVVSGINANIMSLGGIAIAIGVMVDSAIVMVENAHKHIEQEQHDVQAGRPAKPRAQLISEASREVGPSLFYALLIIVVSFLPIFVLGGQSGRMFAPLAFTKTFAMASGAILAVTLIPALMIYFVSDRVLPASWSRAKQWVVGTAVVFLPAVALAVWPLPGLENYHWVIVVGWVVVATMVMVPQRIPSEQHNWLSRFMQWLYNPLFNLAMTFRWPMLVLTVLVAVATVWPWSKLGSEFMPPLNEGDLLYMPTTDPGLSITTATQILQQTDKLIHSFPEVKTVFGKVGRADTATDPAPLSMIETIIQLHQDKHYWRTVPVARFFDDWPGWLRSPLAYVWPSNRIITTEELIHGYDLPAPGHNVAGVVHVPGLDDAIQFPGLTNAWTMPIKTRIDMLATGIKTPVGVKIMGPDLHVLADLAKQVAQTLKTDPSTAGWTASAFADKTTGGNYLDIQPRREAMARYGLSMEDVQEVIASAAGGMNITTTLEGLQRYSVNLRYPRELRDSIDQLKNMLVATPKGQQVPLSQLATFDIHKGPAVVKSENARPTAWVLVDIDGLDVGTYVTRAQQAVAESVKLPAGYSLVWSGQYEYMLAAKQKLLIAVPLALILIVILLYLATKSWLQTAMVLLAEPFALIGAVWLVYLMGYNLSLAVWVGMIALAGLAAETGLIMLLYLHNSYERHRKMGRMRNKADLWEAVHEGAVQRIRPKTMTVLSAGMGLLPLLWASGAGADTMRRLAVPMIGGLVTSFPLELLVFPAVFYMAKSLTLPKQPAVEQPEQGRPVSDESF